MANCLRMGGADVVDRNIVVVVSGFLVFARTRCVLSDVPRCFGNIATSGCNLME